MSIAPEDWWLHCPHWGRWALRPVAPGDDEDLERELRYLDPPDPSG